MSPFEKEVRAALHEWDNEYEWNLRGDCFDSLAERIAAAILSAASDGYWSASQGYPPVGTTVKALAALRGRRIAQ